MDAPVGDDGGGGSGSAAPSGWIAIGGDGGVGEIGGGRRRIMDAPVGDGGGSAAPPGWIAIGGDGGGRRRIMYDPPLDDVNLSPLLCLVKSQIELFEATPFDVKSRAPRGGTRDHVGIGSVGVRCLHCAGANATAAANINAASSSESDGGKAEEPIKPARGAVSYPKSVRLVYQSVRNWQRHHILACKAMPPSIRDEFVRLKEGNCQKRAGSAGNSYWEGGCRRWGLYDAGESGIRLIGGVGVDGSAAGPPKAPSAVVSDGDAAPPPQSQVPVQPLAQTVEQLQTAAPQTRPQHTIEALSDDSISAIMDDIDVQDFMSALGADLAPSSSNGLPSTGADDGGTADALSDSIVASMLRGSLHRSFAAAPLTAPVRRFDSGGSARASLARTNAVIANTATLEQPDASAAAVAAFAPALALAPDPLPATAPAPAVAPGGSAGDDDDAMPPAPSDALMGPLNLEDDSALAAAMDASCLLSELDLNIGSDSAAFLGAEAVGAVDGATTAGVAAPPLANAQQPVAPAAVAPVPAAATSPAVPSSAAAPPAQLGHFAESVAIAPSAAVAPSDDYVLERVRLAHGLVSTVVEKKDLDDLQPWHAQDSLKLGIELFNLFAGSRPFDDADGGTHDAVMPTVDEEGDDDDVRALDDSDRRRKRRGHQVADSVGNGGQRTFIPLSHIGFPVALCNVVNSLLNGDGRYSSGKEVEEDLLLLSSEPDCFLFDACCFNSTELPKLDISSSAVYGREKEAQSLLDAYDRAVSVARQGNFGGKSLNRRRDVVLLSGYAGVGKSTLVRRVKSEYERRGACFVSGKFDAMRQMEPLSAVVAALNEYCSMLALQEADVIEEIREELTNAVGAETKVLVDLIPSLGKILPKEAVAVTAAARRRSSSITTMNTDSLDSVSAPEFSRHSSATSSNCPEAPQRLHFLIRALFRATCDDNHPAVLFLDDLQWADNCSLDLLKDLVTDEQLKALLFVGCYRHNEVGADHLLNTAFLDRLKSTTAAVPINVVSIRIGDMDQDSMNSLVSYSLHLLPRLTLPLADVVHQKTGGNPLFAVQFLSSLHDSGLLRYSLSSKAWTWDLDRIKAKEIAHDVVEFVKAKLVTLDPEVKEALRTAAALGAQCHGDVLRILDRDPGRIGSVSGALDVAVTKGLVGMGDDSYHFSHDQIQRASYLLVPEPEREAFHLSVGRALRNGADEDELEEYLFVVVGQLNRGASLISDGEERARAARLSLSAAQKAAAMSAFPPALAFVTAGQDLLSDGDWDDRRHRRTCFELYGLCAEMKYAVGDFDGMTRTLDVIFSKANSLKEKLPAYSTLVQSMIAQGRANDAIDTAMTVLNWLGESLPPVSTENIVRGALEATDEILRGKSEMEIIRLELMKDPEKKEAMKFLNTIASASYTERLGIFPIVVCRMVHLSLFHGVCSESAVGFCWYGVIRCGRLGDLEGGYRLGRVALSILDRFQSQGFVGRVHAIVHGFINNWKEPIQSSLPSLKHAVDEGLAVGDTEYAMLSAHLFTGTALCTGYPLASLYDEMKSYSKSMVEYNQQYIWTYNKPLRQATLNLLGRSADPVKLVGEEMDEGNLLEDTENQSVLVAVTRFYRMWLQYLFGEYDLAAESAKKNESLVSHIVTRFAVVCNHIFFEGLIALALARKEGQANHKETIDRTMAQMEIWASAAAWNCQHKLELMKAEYAYLVGDVDEAIKAYDLAVNLAVKHRFVHEEALALERAGLFYLESGDHATASGLFVRACNCYERWGAWSKAAHVRKQFL